MGQALLALAAVIIGAAASTGGAMIIQRRDLTRRYLTQLYQNDVRALKDELSAGRLSTPEISDRVQGLLVTATLASRRNRRRVIPMWDIAFKIAFWQQDYDRWIAVVSADPAANRRKAADAEESRQEEIKRLSRELSQYQNWLDDWFAGEFRIRRRVARRMRRRRVERSD